MGQQILRFFIFTSLFLAVCAGLMLHQTAVLFSLTVPPALTSFLFFGSVCSYNFHWLLSPADDRASAKAVWHRTNRAVHQALAVIGFLGAAVSLYQLRSFWLLLSLSSLLPFLYSIPQINHPLAIALRRVAVGKTIFLAASWTHATVVLPMLVCRYPIEQAELLFIVNRFSFIYAVCILFDLRDRDHDRSLGIKSLITWLNTGAVYKLFLFSLLLVAVTSILLVNIWSVILLAVLTFPAILLGLLYQYARRTRSDFFYYFLLDGLMALSAPMVILAKFAR